MRITNPTTDNSKDFITAHQPGALYPSNRTTPGIGPGGRDKHTLARDQERHARDQAPIVRPDASSHDANAIYRIYTEHVAGVLDIVARYFDGATLTYATGLWRGVQELSVVLEIIGTVADREQIVALCEDIRATNAQHTVLATMQTARALDSIVVTAPSVIGSADVVGV